MLIYILKSMACMALFFFFYKLLLEKENMHVFKRIYLILALVASLLIPELVFTEFVEPVVNTYSNSNTFKDTTTTIVTEAPARDIDVINWSLIAWSIYSVGFAIFGIRFMRNLFQILNRIRKNLKQKSANFIQVLLEENFPPHTFFNYIFLNKKKLESNQIPKEVLLHEETHARQKHSYDVILMELLQVIFWFNPFIFLFKKAIKLNHEFLADQAVVNNGFETFKYQNILLAFSSNAMTPKFSNSINYASVKKRFKVMKTRTSKKSMLFRIFLILPMLCLMLYGFSETEIVAKERTSLNVDLKNQTTISDSSTIYPKRTIELSGLVVDSETYEPIKNANILNSNGELLATTDSKGYYNLQFDILKPGEIHFELVTNKHGYQPFILTEHWGNLPRKIKSGVIFGIQGVQSEKEEFYELVIDSSGMNYHSFLTTLEEKKAGIKFEEKIENLKKGNNYVFFEMNEGNYLVNKSSWIKINSRNNLVSIDDEKTVPAFEINKYVDRNDITGMTPLDSKNAQYAIYTIPVDNGVRPLKNSIDSPKNNHLTQKGASPKQIEEYNSLAKKYNTMLSKSNSVQIKIKDVERLEYIYSLMSEKQKAAAESFPDFPKPPPPPEAPKKPKNIADIDYDADQIKTIIKNQDPYDDMNTIAALTYKNGRNSSFRASNIPKTPSSRYIAGNNYIGKIEYDISKKELETIKMPTGLVQPKTPKTPNEREEAAKKIERIIKEQDPYDAVGANIKLSGTPAEPVVPIYLSNKNIMIETNELISSIKSPSPKQPLEHIIDMAEQGAEFYYEGKKISSDQAIELVKENKNLDISTIKNDSKNTEVKISKAPVKIGSAAKEFKLLDYAITLKEKNAIFYLNDKSISAKEGILIISNKKYASVKTLPWVNKRPEVKIYDSK